MTFNGEKAVIVRYFSEFAYLPGVLRKSSRSLSHLVTSSCKVLYCQISTEIIRPWHLHSDWFARICAVWRTTVTVGAWRWLMVSWSFKPRLHDTTKHLLSNRLSHQFDNRLNVCIHDTTGCQTGCQTPGCIVYTAGCQTGCTTPNWRCRLNE